jgi:sporulation protein YunB
MKLKKKKRINLLIIPIILIILVSYINKTITPKLEHYASIEIKRLSNLIITQSIKVESLEKININELFIINKNEKNEILTVDINTPLLNKVILEWAVNIQDNLKTLEQGKLNTDNEQNKKGTVIKIPLGQIYNNFLLNNRGPKIPVKLKILGDMETKVNTNIKNYGINNALIEITLDIKITEEVILPITTKEITVTQTIPLAMKIIEGLVPNYYSGEINKTSTFSIPIE